MLDSVVCLLYNWRLWARLPAAIQVMSPRAQLPLHHPPPPTPLSFPEVLSREDQRLEKTVEIEFSQSVGRSKSDRWEGGGGGGEGDSLAAQHSKSCNFETEQQK